MLNAISAGRVSVRKNARLHLALHGLAYCGAGTGRILGPVRDLAAKAVAALCRRCIRKVRELVQEGVHEAMRRRNRIALAALNRLSDALRTPAEVAQEEKTLDEIRTAIRTGANQRPIRSFADLRAAHLAAVERDREDRNAQLPLCGVAA